MNMVRPLMLNDMPAAAALEALCFPSCWSTEQFSRAWREPWFAAYGSFVSSSLAAYITFSILDDELEVLNIAVRPDCRGRGLAHNLMAHALADLLKNRSWERVFLEVRPENAPALALYAGVGFQPEALRRKYYADGGDAAVLSLHRADFLAAMQAYIQKHQKEEL